MIRVGTRPVSTAQLYVGLMSGTSLDGIDAVLADFDAARPRILAGVHEAFDPAFRAALLELCAPGANELERAASLGNELSRRYAAAVAQVLAKAEVDRSAVQAVGCHGQTVRHRPDLGFTIQIGNASLLAELSGIRVVADFRSRDVAAGGQGAPLVPAFHAAMFSNPAENRAVLNLGGIANISLLPRRGAILGFDSGPGNCLLDLWASKHLGTAMDEGGTWAAGGQVIEPMLTRLLEDPYFATPPPKSTGRERFNEAWLLDRLPPDGDPRSVQATLLDLTARSVVDACRRYCGATERMLVCGGGANNTRLVQRLRELLSPARVETTREHGLEPTWVEATAFAWLAKQALAGAPGNLPSVTGARGPRVLGAVYPS